MSQFRYFLLLILLIPCVIFAASTAQDWQMAGVSKSAAAKFLSQLQQAVTANNKKAVAVMVQYPLRFPGSVANSQHANHPPIKNAKSFIQQYKQIMTSKVVNAIKQQKVSSLFTNYQGVMIGGGEIWFGTVMDGGSQTVKIIAINH